MRIKKVWSNTAELEQLLSIRMLENENIIITSRERTRATATLRQGVGESLSLCIKMTIQREKRQNLCFKERSRDISQKILDETHLSGGLELGAMPALQVVLLREEKDSYDAWKEMCGCGSQLCCSVPRHTRQEHLLTLVFMPL